MNLRRLAAVLFLLGLLRVLWAERAAEAQSWRTPTRRPTPDQNHVNAGNGG